MHAASRLVGLSAYVPVVVAADDVSYVHSRGLDLILWQVYYVCFVLLASLLHEHGHLEGHGSYSLCFFGGEHEEAFRPPRCVLTACDGTEV